MIFKFFFAFLIIVNAISGSFQISLPVNQAQKLEAQGLPFCGEIFGCQEPFCTKIENNRINGKKCFDCVCS